MLDIIVEAFSNSDVGYLAKTLAMHNPGTDDVTGSVFETRQSIGSLRCATWTEFEPAPNARFGECRYFRAEIPGRVGILELRDLHPTTVVTLQDRKETGFIEAELFVPRIENVHKPLVGFTTLVIGPDHGKTVVYTFHPGDPVAPSNVTSFARRGKVTTAKEALALGLRTVKLTEKQD